MAEHNCPKCKKNTFSWSIDEDVSPLTNWGCRNCNYFAYEDESNQTNCKKCKGFSKIQLQDETTGYWWCSNCDNITNITLLSAGT